MADIAIRVAMPDDCDVLSKIIAAFCATLADGAYEPQMLAGALPVAWTLETPGSGEFVGGMAHIRRFATHLAHLHKGIARLLVKRCRGEAATAGACIMKSQSTLPVEKFYASVGFRRVRRIAVAPGVVPPAVEMKGDIC